MERNPRELWLENLQRQHAGAVASTRGGAAAHMTNLPKSAASHAPFLSTPPYVRQAAAAAAGGDIPTNIGEGMLPREDAVRS